MMYLLQILLFIKLISNCLCSFVNAKNILFLIHLRLQKDDKKFFEIVATPNHCLEQQFVNVRIKNSSFVFLLMDTGFDKHVGIYIVMNIPHVFRIPKFSIFCSNWLQDGK